MMQGLTASHFATDFYPVQKGDIALVHAAAGGLGLLLTQIIKLRGGHVIGRVSSHDKVAAACQAGADHVIVDTEGNFAERRSVCPEARVLMLSMMGRGPDIPGIAPGMRRSGTFCWYGPVLGGPGPLDIMKLPRSIKIGYAVFSDHIHTTERLRAHSAKLFDWILKGRLDVRIGRKYRLSDAAKAHADMESRATIGKLLLIP